MKRENLQTILLDVDLLLVNVVVAFDDGSG